MSFSRSMRFLAKTRLVAFLNPNKIVWRDEDPTKMMFLSSASCDPFLLPLGSFYITCFLRWFQLWSGRRCLQMSPVTELLWVLVRKMQNGNWPCIFCENSRARIFPSAESVWKNPGELFQHLRWTQMKLGSGTVYCILWKRMPQFNTTHLYLLLLLLLLLWLLLLLFPQVYFCFVCLSKFFPFHTQSCRLILFFGHPSKTSHQKGFSCRSRDLTVQCVWPTRWAPTSHKWSYNSHKWPYTWVTGILTPYKWSCNPTCNWQIEDHPT